MIDDALTLHILKVYNVRHENLPNTLLTCVGNGQNCVLFKNKIKLDMHVWAILLTYLLYFLHNLLSDSDIVLSISVIARVFICYFLRRLTSLLWFFLISLEMTSLVSTNVADAQLCLQSLIIYSPNNIWVKYFFMFDFISWIPLNVVMINRFA